MMTLPKKIALTVSLALTLSIAIYLTINFTSRSVTLENTKIEGDVRISNDARDK